MRFLWRVAPAVLPVWRAGRLAVARWGSKGRRVLLPYSWWTWDVTVRQGGWAHAWAEPADVPASYLWAGGVWFKVVHGLRALVVPDPTAGGEPAAYLICQPSTRHYHVASRWLSADTVSADLLGLLVPFPADGMEAVPVGPAVNSPKNDGPECIAPAW